MQSKAPTVAEYLASLPTERRHAMLEVRDVILANLDADYEEGMSYGMIGYSVPHRLFPPGYHCNPKQPLPFAGLASQKNYLSLYIMVLYAEGDDSESNWFRKAWAKTGKKLDMGKCCIRFKKVEDLALDVIAEALRRMPVKRYVEVYTGELAKQGKGVDGKPLKKAREKATATKATAKTSAGPKAKAPRNTGSKGAAKPKPKAATKAATAKSRRR